MTAFVQPHIAKHPRGGGPKTKRQQRDLQRRQLAEAGVPVPPMARRRRKDDDR